MLVFGEYPEKTSGYQRFFLACVGELLFVGRRPTRVRPKAEDTSGEAASTRARLVRGDSSHHYAILVSLEQEIIKDNLLLLSLIIVIITL